MPVVPVGVVLRTSLVLICAIGCNSGVRSDKAEARQCEQLRDRIVDLRLATASGIDAKDLAAHREALRDAMGPRFIASCTESFTEDQVDCATKAPTLETLASCTPTR